MHPCYNKYKKELILYEDDLQEESEGVLQFEILWSAVQQKVKELFLKIGNRIERTRGSFSLLSCNFAFNQSLEEVRLISVKENKLHLESLNSIHRYAKTIIPEVIIP